MFDHAIDTFTIYKNVFYFQKYNVIRGESHTEVWGTVEITVTLI